MTCSYDWDQCPMYKIVLSPLRWRQNGRDSVSTHQPHDCLFNRLFRRRSKKTSKLRVTGLCVGNSPGPVNSPHKGPVTRKMFPFDDVIMRRIYVSFTSVPWSLPSGLVTSLQTHYTIITSFWHFNNNVIITSCVQWGISVLLQELWRCWYGSSSSSPSLP